MTLLTHIPGIKLPLYSNCSHTSDSSPPTTALLQRGHVETHQIVVETSPRNAPPAPEALLAWPVSQRPCELHQVFHPR